MCAICNQFDKNNDLSEFKEMLNAAHREIGSIDEAHLTDLEETLAWYEEQFE